MTRKVPLAIKKSVIESDSKGIKATKIAEIYNLNVNTVRGILMRYKKTECLEKPTGKRPNKLSQEIVDDLRSWFDTDCTITLSEAKDKLFEKYDVNVCIQTIKNYLDKIHFSFKRISLVPERRNDPRVVLCRKIYAMEFMRLFGSRDVFFLGETDIKVHTRVNYGWSRQGERDNVNVKTIRSKDFSVGAVMDHSRLYFYETKEKSFNTELPKEFIKKFIEKLKDDKIKNAIIVMDNDPFHHSEEILSLVNENHHSIMFLPPYSPFLNPIEKLFSQLKHHVEKFKPNDADDVFTGVELVAQVISESDCTNYFKYMMTYLPRCKNVEIIEN
ncbi:uncharacterized protein LOC107369801 [Tetranychus urticae]|uniref:Tc1-like transposase DDE domain-containing protein n=1 Tax=Tetranychus urticae TaxID=32264 RepID=A0A158P5J7_TETUR|nr:uncharacterized protein LOC107369801 [Tetranychus urticae]